MRRYETRQELANKIDNEGGPEEFLFGYGCDPEDMPDEELEVLVREIYEVAAPLLRRFSDLIPEPGPEDGDW